MNIFFLFLSAIDAAMALCDKHVVSQAKETAQMLCSAWRKLHGQKLKKEIKSITDQSLSEKAQKDADQLKLYKMTHAGHPMTIWVSSSKENFIWAIQHGIALCNEWKVRYNHGDDREHACMRIYRFMQDHIDDLVFEQSEMTIPPQCMPEEYRVEYDVVSAYRSYYRGDKMGFAKWSNREKPSFL